MKKTILRTILAFCLIAVLGLTLLFFKPYAPAVTVEGIRFGLNGGADAQIGENCYTLAPHPPFAQAFAFGDWQETRDKPTGDPLIRLRLAEEWVIKLYADGKVSAHYGYASRDTKGHAYYLVPTDCIGAIKAYIEENGIPQAEPFGESHFRH